MLDHSSESITIVSRSGLFRNGLRSLLNDSAFSVVDELQSIDQTECEVAGIVLLDAGMTPLDMLDEVRSFIASQPATPVVVLADMLEWSALVAFLRAGTSGYLMKDISTEALVGSLRLVLLGEKVYPTEMSALLMRGVGTGFVSIGERAVLGTLSARENEILRHLVEGDSNKLIARRLDVAEATVKVHMKSLLRKLKCSNRTQAAIWAVNHGMHEMASNGSGNGHGNGHGNGNGNGNGAGNGHGRESGTGPDDDESGSTSRETFPITRQPAMAAAGGESSFHNPK